MNLSVTTSILLLVDFEEKKNIRYVLIFKKTEFEM